MKQNEYYDIIKEQLERQFTEEKDTIEQAAQYCAKSVLAKHVVIHKCSQWKCSIEQED